MSLLNAKESMQDVSKALSVSLESMMLAFPIGHPLRPYQELFQSIDQASHRLRSIHMENIDAEFLHSIKGMGFSSHLRKITIRNFQGKMGTSLFSHCDSLESLIATLWSLYLSMAEYSTQVPQTAIRLVFHISNV